MTPRTGFIKSIDRAIKVLDAVAAAGPNGVPLRALSDKLGINPSTLHHLLATLRHHLMIDQDPLTKRYRLGVHLIELGNAALQATSIAQVAQEYLTEIQEKIGHGASLLAFHGLLRTKLTSLDSNQPLTAASAPIDVSTLHATGSGKVLLAYLPHQELHQYLAQTRLERFTAATITDPEQLLEELKRIRAEGISYDRGEHGSSIWCLAAPVQDATLRVMGCLDVVFPRHTVSTEQVSQMAEILRSVAQRFSAQIKNIGLVAG
jgi:DNA-binding IclR family transcriptional regulator